MPLDEADHRPTATRTLIDDRRAAADAKFEAFDFGDGNDVEDADGWEYTNDGDEMTRKVYFRHAEHPDADSERGHFTVRFENRSDVISEAYGSLNGAIFEDRVEVPAGPRS